MKAINDNEIFEGSRLMTKKRNPNLNKYDALKNTV